MKYLIFFVNYDNYRMYCTIFADMLRAKITKFDNFLTNCTIFNESPNNNFVNCRTDASKVTRGQKYSPSKKNFSQTLVNSSFWVKLIFSKARKSD